MREWRQPLSCLVPLSRFYFLGWREVMMLMKKWFSFFLFLWVRGDSATSDMSRVWEGTCVSDSDHLISGGEGYWRFLLFWAIALFLLDHPKLWNKAPQPAWINSLWGLRTMSEATCISVLYSCFLLNHGFHVTPRYLEEKLKENMEPEKLTVRGISRTHRWCLYCLSNLSDRRKILWKRRVCISIVTEWTFFLWF